MNEKKWYTSKTLWVNALMLISSLVAGASGGLIQIDPQDTAGIVAVVNMILRILTKTGLSG